MAPPTYSLLTLTAGLIAACYAPDLGPEPFLCGTTDPQCPDGYVCEGTVCTNHPTTGPDGGLRPDSSSGSCTMPYSGMLASWTFAGSPGTQTSNPPASNAPGVVAGDLTRAPALTATAGTDSINSSNWPTGPLDSTKYYTLSITPPAGCSLVVSGMAVDVLSSSTGPSSGAVATSADGYAQTISVSTTAPSSPTLTVNGVNEALEIRVFGFSASATAGTMRLRNTLSVTGSLQ